MNTPRTLLALAVSLALPAMAAPNLRPPANPYLSAPVYGVTHMDPSQSDAIPYPVKRGTFKVNLATMPQVEAGVFNNFNLQAAVPGFMWAISTDRVSYVDARNGGWKRLAYFSYPGMEPIKPEQHRTLLTGNYKSVAEVDAATRKAYGAVPAAWMRNGIYSVADKDNTVYVSAGYTIMALGLKNPDKPEEGIELKRSINIKEHVRKGTTLVGLGIDWNGRLVFASESLMGTLDREFKEKPQVFEYGDGEINSNSFALDENNAVYIATDHYLRKIVFNGKELSDKEEDGGWRSRYDTGDVPPTIKWGTGTGSTPTLMGFGQDPDKLVVITDGSNNMNLVAFWRDQIPAGFQQKPGTKSRRIADQIKITAGYKQPPAFLQSEQSVSVNGYGAFVVNNIAEVPIKDKIIDVVAIGPVTPTPKGAERLQWDTENDRWQRVWSRPDLVSTSMVPAVSTPSGIVFVNGYTAKDGWEVTGLDWNSGKTVHRTLFGHDNYGNGAYSIFQFHANGDLMFNSIAGPFRVKL